METLKSAVPDALKQEIAKSTPAQLQSTCSSLLYFFHNLPQFHQVLSSSLFSTTCSFFATMCFLVLYLDSTCFYASTSFLLLVLLCTVSAILLTVCFFAIPQMIKDLTDPSVALCCKDRNAALEAKLKGNECFSKGEYSNALLFYSKVSQFCSFLLNYTIDIYRTTAQAFPRI